MPRRQPTRPTTRRRRVWIALVAAFVVVLGASGIVVWRLSIAGSAGTSTQRTVTVSEQTIKEAVGTTGTVEPRHRADLSFSSSGTVTHVYVGVGDKVSKGERLAAIDDDALRADLTAAKADYGAAQADQATAADDADSTAAELKAAASKVTAMRSKVSQARTALKAAILRSPIKGTVAVVDIAKGDSVGSTNGSSSSGGPESTSAAVTVISTSSYLVNTSVGSSDLPKIKKGLQAEITTIGSTEPVYGTVASVAVMASSPATTSASSAGSATFDVTIAVTGQPSKLYAGATATVSIIVKQRDNVLTVPTAAISTTDGKTTVDKLVNGKAVATEISIGTTSGAGTEVTKGLRAGDQVVVTSAARASGNSSTRGQNGTQQGGPNGGNFRGGGGQFPRGGGVQVQNEQQGGGTR